MLFPYLNVLLSVSGHTNAIDGTTTAKLPCLFLEVLTRPRTHTRTHPHAHNLLFA